VPPETTTTGVVSLGRMRVTQYDSSRQLDI
jgi:hypothetical protein